MDPITWILSILAFIHPRLIPLNNEQCDQIRERFRLTLDGFGAERLSQPLDVAYGWGSDRVLKP